MYLDGLGYEAGDLAGGAELDDLLHVPHVLLGVGAEGASVGVRVHRVVHATLEQRRTRTARSASEDHICARASHGVNRVRVCVPG